MVEKLADTLRSQVEEVRQLERAVLHTCVDRAGMPRSHFIKVFPGNETNLDWVLQEVAGGHPYAETLERQVPAVQELQQKLIDLQTRVRSEEHTSELQSLMRTPYAVFCLKNKTNKHRRPKQ